MNSLLLVLVYHFFLSRPSVKKIKVAQISEEQLPRQYDKLLGVTFKKNVFNMTSQKISLANFLFTLK